MDTALQLIERPAVPLPPIAFELPAELEAHSPPEARGLPRDAVRLMVSRYGTDEVAHTRFFRLFEFLNAGDVLVVNTSGTLPAAVDGVRGDGSAVVVHFSTALSESRHVVEVRRAVGDATEPFFSAEPTETITFSNGETLQLIAPFAKTGWHLGDKVRLWVAELSTARIPLLKELGRPIRYSYVPERWPLASYQTVFAEVPGSAEMPSAGRAFSAELVTRLVRRGVQFAPVLLHTGVASLEEGEAPYPERFSVSSQAAAIVNEARANGGRVIAVGTTAVRALEAAATDGVVFESRGWADLVISAENPPTVIDGLITGFHEPKATHLAMLSALAGNRHIAQAYEAAIRQRYLWHEFGDLHLIAP